MAKSNLKIFLIGWNENGEKCLEILLNNNFNIVYVLVPEGYKTQNMYEIAKKHGINIGKVGKDINKLSKHLTKTEADLLISASFPRLIPKEVLEIPKLGAINIHAGKLPKYRGYHPINWAIIKDEKEIGVTVHYIDEGMDTGNVLSQDTIAISNLDDVNTIRKKITDLGAKLLIKTVRKIEKSKVRLKGTEQRDSEVIFAPRRYPRNGKIKWSNNTRDIFNLVRALKSPAPNAFGQTKSGVKIEFQSSFINKIPGQVLGKFKKFYIVSTGDGVIFLKSSKKLKIGEVLS